MEITTVPFQKRRIALSENGVTVETELKVSLAPNITNRKLEGKDGVAVVETVIRGYCWIIECVNSIDSDAYNILSSNLSQPDVYFDITIFEDFAISQKEFLRCKTTGQDGLRFKGTAMF